MAVDVHICDARDFDGGDVLVTLMGVYDHLTRIEVFSQWQYRTWGGTLRLSCHIHGYNIFVENLRHSHEGCYIDVIFFSELERSIDIFRVIILQDLSVLTSASWLICWI